MSFDAFRGIGNLPTRLSEALGRPLPATHFMLTADELKGIEARITELSEIVTQNALTASDAPQAGWGFDPAATLSSVQARLDALVQKED